MKATQQTYEKLNNDYLALQEKLEHSNEKYKFAALLMAEFLDDILEDRMNILTMDAQSNNLVELCKKIRETPFDDLATDLKRELMFALLKQL